MLAFKKDHFLKSGYMSFLKQLQKIYREDHSWQRYKINFYELFKFILPIMLVMFIIMYLHLQFSESIEYL